MQREDILKRISEIEKELARRKKNDRLAHYNVGKKRLNFKPSMTTSLR